MIRKLGIESDSHGYKHQQHEEAIAQEHETRYEIAQAYINTAKASREESFKRYEAEAKEIFKHWLMTRFSIDQNQSEQLIEDSDQAKFLYLNALRSGIKVYEDCPISGLDGTFSWKSTMRGENTVEIVDGILRGKWNSSKSVNL
ncbi:MULTISPECIES: hypothetical protein [unclassified Leptolyngbya]|uniref:hypothetical protein n=1 Tax=unclassified Leptolyngbya TaxID=2650499 RepID=UPI003D30FD31